MSMCSVSESTTRVGGRPSTLLAALLEDLFQVAGELEGQGVQSVLSLRGKGGHGFLHRLAVQRCGRFLQLGQQLLHGNRVQRLLAGQLAGSFEHTGSCVQNLVLWINRILGGLQPGEKLAIHRSGSPHAGMVDMMAGCRRRWQRRTLRQHAGHYSFSS